MGYLVQILRGAQRRQGCDNSEATANEVGMKRCHFILKCFQEIKEWLKFHETLSTRFFHLAGTLCLPLPLPAISPHPLSVCLPSSMQMYGRLYLWELEFDCVGLRYTTYDISTLMWSPLKRALANKRESSTSFRHRICILLLSCTSHSRAIRCWLTNESRLPWEAFLLALHRSKRIGWLHCIEWSSRELSIRNKDGQVHSSVYPPNPSTETNGFDDEIFS